MPPQYIKPYVKRGKNDKVDAEAICEAMSRPTMRFVPVKSAEQQAALTMLGVRDVLVKQRTMLINAIRGPRGGVRRHRSQGTQAGERAAAALGKRRGRTDAGARDGQHAGQPARRAGHQVESDRGAADGLASAGSDQPVLGDHPGDRADRRRQLCPQGGRPAGFRSGRHFASWIGITPRENSTAGRQKLGRISRAGDEDLRRLLVIGATAVIRVAKPGRTSPWLLALLARKSKKLAAVALANKMARIIRAMMVSGETYRRPAQA